MTIILLFTFCFSFICLPYNYALASEITAAPKMVDKASPVSDTTNQPDPHGNVIIAPPSDFPAKSGNERVEISSRRSVNSMVYLEPDGTLTQEIYPKSIFYKNNKLQWIPIENNLVTAEAPSKVKNKTNRFSVLFEAQAKVRFEKKESLIDIQPVDAAPSQGVVNETKLNTATFTIM